MPNVGYATIQIIPSVRGISDELRRQLVGPAGDAGEDAGEAAGGGLKEKLTIAAAAVGVAAGALLVAGINEAMEQANISSTLQAQLGATGKDASRYGIIAGNLYSKGITESFQAGADAIRSVVNAGLVRPDATNAQLESISAKMSDVASTFGVDMSLQTQAVAAMLKNGVAPSAEAALDVITVGFQKLGPNAEDLLETFQEYSIQFRKLGIDSEQALGLFQQGIAAGARDTDIIADAFKEFGIRAIDMSTSSQDAYKAIGLDAEKMSLQIAKGGKGASAGLQLVLDKLRGIKDPVKQNAAAVGLYGTQAEDLGQALFKLDPSKAAGAFGTVSGAAADLGKTLHSGPSHEIEVFTRTLKQGFVNFLGGEVLPVITTAAHFFNAVLLPPIRAVASVVAAVLLPALTALWKGGTAVVDWLRDMGLWLIPIGIAVTGFTLALTAQAIATAGVAAVFAVYRGAITAWMAVQRAGILIQAAFNAVMAANPVILIITAIIALGAALVIAYKKSETFRTIVQTAWKGIQTAAMLAWNNYLKPTFAAIVTALQAVGRFAMWLWTNVLSPVFAFIAAAAKILFTIVVVIVLLPIIAIFKALAKVAMWLWKTILQPAFQGIGALAMWLWTNMIKPYLSLIMAGFKLLATVAMWLWRNVIMPVFRGIGAAISVWWLVIKVIFNLVMAFIRGPLATVFRWLWANVIEPVWKGIRSAISTAWVYGIKPVFDALSRGVGLVREAFRKAVDGIGRIWDSLKGIARKPVQYIVDVVYNDGVRKVWNTVADFTGAPKLNPVKFAQGGRTRGGVPGRDSIPALMMADEYVVKRDSARKIGFSNLDYMNRYGALPGFATGGRVQRFKDGGIVDWLKGGASKAGSFLGDAASFLTDPGKAWGLATKAIRDRIASISGTGLGKLMAGIPLKILSSLKEKVTSLVGAVGGGSSAAATGGAGVQRWSSVVLQALRMVGQPAGYLGITLRRMAQESGGNPNIVNRWDSNWLAGHPSVGLMQVIGPTFRAYAGALANTGPFMYGVSTMPLANVYASMRYALAAYGSLPAAYNRAGGYDSGGWLQPGLTTAVNATGRPEAVLTGPQWQAMSSLASRGASLDGSRLRLVVRDREFDAYLEDVADGRVEATLRPAMAALNAGMG